MLQRSRIAVVYLLGFGLDLVNMFVINAAYPALGRELRASVAQLAWVGNAYMLGLTIVIPVGVWLAARCGERRVLLASLLLFAAGAAGAASAESGAALLAWRLVQGLGGGLLIPVGQAMTYRAYPVAERARLTSLIMMVALLVPALSPAVGGIVVDRLSWRWIFIAMLPLALSTAVLALRWVPADPRPSAFPGALDRRGLMLSVSTLVGLLLGLTWLGRRGHGVAASLALAMAALAGVAYRRGARRHPAPLLDLRLLSQPLLRTGVVVYLCVPGVFMGVSLVASLYLQDALGFSATRTGALMLPWAAAAFAAIGTTRGCFARSGPKPLFAAGVLVQCAGMLLLAAPWSAAHGEGLGIAYALMGFGGSLCSSTAQSAAFLAVPAASMGQASALWNINRQLSFCLGVAVLGSLLNGGLASVAPGHDAESVRRVYRYCFAAAAVLTLLPLPLIVRLSTGDTLRLLRGEATAS
ncbi:MFS transporter [Burkholderia alba]|uniref:MFS transporter n=1 Tax=Burkholderia alba TaxID=2683677 RepID=UPI002B053BD6|nr:MFS transporter [Burkholderia alba]